MNQSAHDPVGIPQRERLDELRLLIRKLSEERDALTARARADEKRESAKIEAEETENRTQEWRDRETAILGALERGGSPPEDIESIQRLLRSAAAHQRDRSVSRKRRRSLIRWLLRVFTGRTLAGAIRQWRATATRDEIFPEPATSNLAAAIFARLLRVSLAAVVLALAPTVFLVWQNILLTIQTDVIQKQFEEQAEQNDLVRLQFAAQSEQQVRERRTKIFTTLYDERPCFADEPPAVGHTGCPVARIEARTAAALELIEMDEAIRRSPQNWAGLTVERTTDLSRIDLRGARLEKLAWKNLTLDKADLSNANLHGSFTKVSLKEASLRGAVLAFAKLDGVDLRRADLRGASLHGAEVSAMLEGADFRGSMLDGVKLKVVSSCEGCDFRGADIPAGNVSGAGLNGAIACPPGTDLETQWGWDSQSARPIPAGVLEHECCSFECLTSDFEKASYWPALARDLFDNGLRRTSAVVALEALRESILLDASHMNLVRVDDNAPEADFTQQLSRLGYYSDLEREQITQWMKLGNYAKYGVIDFVAAHSSAEVEMMMTGIKVFVSRSEQRRTESTQNLQTVSKHPARDRR